MTVPKPQKRWLVDQLPVELYTSNEELGQAAANKACLLYTSPSPRDSRKSRMPSSA